MSEWKAHRKDLKFHQSSLYKDCEQLSINLYSFLLSLFGRDTRKLVTINSYKSHVQDNKKIIRKMTADIKNEIMLCAG
jgi:hypothetical protein